MSTSHIPGHSSPGEEGAEYGHCNRAEGGALGSVMAWQEQIGGRRTRASSPDRRKENQSQTTAKFSKGLSVRISMLHEPFIPWNYSRTFMRHFVKSFSFLKNPSTMHWITLLVFSLTLSKNIPEDWQGRSSLWRSLTEFLHSKAFPS